MLSKLINGIVSVLGAAITSQFPAFFQQYQQRLGGSLDQAKVAVGRVEQVAQALGMTVDNMVERFMLSRDEAYQSLGAINIQALQDLARLEKADAALAEATGADKFLQFINHLDPVVVEGAWRAFEPAVPLTTEALVYAGIGMLSGILFLAIIEFILRGGWRRMA